MVTFILYYSCVTYTFKVCWPNKLRDNRRLRDKDHHGDGPTSATSALLFCVIAKMAISLELVSLVGMGVTQPFIHIATTCLLSICISGLHRHPIHLFQPSGLPARSCFKEGPFKTMKIPQFYQGLQNSWMKPFCLGEHQNLHTCLMAI